MEMHALCMDNPMDVFDMHSKVNGMDVSKYVLYQQLRRLMSDL